MVVNTVIFTYIDKAKDDVWVFHCSVMNIVFPSMGKVKTDATPTLKKVNVRVQLCNAVYLI